MELKALERKAREPKELERQALERKELERQALDRQEGKEAREYRMLVRQMELAEKRYVLESAPPIGRKNPRPRSHIEPSRSTSTHSQQQQWPVAKPRGQPPSGTS